MKKAACILLALAALIACKKTTPSIQSPLGIQVLPDSIVYYDFDPDIYVTSIDTIVFCGRIDGEDRYVPMPEDSTASINIDLDGDGTDDFMFYHDRWMGILYISPHAVCEEYYNYKIGVKGLNPGNTIIIDESRYYCIMDPSMFYEPGELITHQGRHDNLSTLLISSAAMGCVNAPLTPDVTIGLVINKNGTNYTGWVSLLVNTNGFTLKDMAINMAPDQRIYANQSVNGN